MNISNFKKAVSNRKISLLIIIILLITIIVLFAQKQNYKFTLLYQYQAIPDITLTNTLNETQNGFIGEVRGFVKFDNSIDQPKNLKQYYIIKPSNKFDENSSQHFSLEEIVVIPYLPPQIVDVTKLIEVNKTNQIVILEDENGNQFFINRITKQITTRDTAGNNAILIMNNSGFGDFMKEFLKK
jgi:hypothetical protein